MFETVTQITAHELADHINRMESLGELSLRQEPLRLQFHQHYPELAVFVAQAPMKELTRAVAAIEGQRLMLTFPAELWPQMLEAAA